MPFNFGQMLATAGAADRAYTQDELARTQLAQNQQLLMAEKQKQQNEVDWQKTLQAFRVAETAQGKAIAGQDAAEGAPQAGTIPYLDRQIQTLQQRSQRNNQLADMRRQTNPQEAELMQRSADRDSQQAVELTQQRAKLAADQSSKIFKQVDFLHNEFNSLSTSERRDKVEEIAKQLQSQGNSDGARELRRIAASQNPKQGLFNLSKMLANDSERAEMDKVEMEKAKLAHDAITKGPAPESSLDGIASMLKQGETIGAKKDMGAAMAKIKQDHPWLSNYEIGKNIEIAKQKNAGLKKAETQLQLVSGFEETAMSNIDSLEQQIEKNKANGVVDAPLVNQFVFAVKNAIGQESSQQLGLFGKEVAAELTKLASTATAAGAGGTLADREEWQKFFSPNSSYEQMKASIQAARQSARNRIEGSQRIIESTRRDIDNLWAHPDEKKAAKQAEKPAEKAPKVVDWSEL